MPDDDDVQLQDDFMPGLGISDDDDDDSDDEVDIDVDEEGGDAEIDEYLDAEDPEESFDDEDHF